MTIGIGGAGGKLAIKLDPNATVVNVSETELEKCGAENRILAVVHAARGQMKGSRKDPGIGHDAFQSIKEELLHLTRGNTVFSSTGGGTGNGITSGILEELCNPESIHPTEKTNFGLILPYEKLEATEFVNNTIRFLEGPLSEAIDSGNTGNLFLFSNRMKFESRLAEDAYNEQVAESLKVFLSIPEKGERYKLIDGHIDQEDFDLFRSRPYFNHFTYFDYAPDRSFHDQVYENLNPYLLAPENPIEALFLLEVPEGWDTGFFYDILQYFRGLNVGPVYSVIENPNIEKAFITVSLLYSRKPAELVADFHRTSEEQTQAKLRKSLEQHVVLPKLEVNMTSEAKKVAQERGENDEEVLAILKRLGKL